MQQDKLWDYLQNEGLQDETFSKARPRFLLRFVQRGSAVLNVGVGAGAFEVLAATRGVFIHSLDPSARAIDRLREQLHMGERAQVGYAQSMPFADRSFDMVVLAEVLEHLDDAVMHGALAEARRTLKSTGTVLVTTPYCEDLSGNTVFCPHCARSFHRYGHVQSFDRLRMRTLLEQHGFTIERLFVSTFVDWRRTGVVNTMKSAARLLLARTGWSVADPHLIVLARIAAAAA